MKQMMRSCLFASFGICQLKCFDSVPPIGLMNMIYSYEIQYFYEIAYFIVKLKRETFNM